MFKIIDNKLQQNELPLLINNKTEIEVIGEFPISSIVYCVVNRDNNSYRFPLLYREQTNEGNIFCSEFFITDQELNYSRTHDVTYTISFTVNNLNIDGVQPIIISPKLIPSSLSINDILLNRLGLLTQMKYGISGCEINGKPAYKGTVPMSVGNGEYVWDYPFNDVHLLIENLSKLVNDLTEEVKKIVERVNNIEMKLTNHLYEQQIL